MNLEETGANLFPLLEGRLDDEIESLKLQVTAVEAVAAEEYPLESYSRVSPRSCLSREAFVGALESWRDYLRLPILLGD